jgi:hypothetical protein
VGESRRCPRGATAEGVFLGLARRTLIRGS